MSTQLDNLPEELHLWLIYRWIEHYDKRRQYPLELDTYRKLKKAALVIGKNEYWRRRNEKEITLHFKSLLPEMGLGITREEIDENPNY